MTAFETFFLQTMDYYEKRGVDVMLHGSTLLRIMRDGTVEPREDVLHDKEINIAIRAEDFTDNFYRQMKRDYPYFNPVNNRLPNSLIFYAQETPKGGEQTQWDIEPGFTLLARFWRGKTKRIEYMGGEHCLRFPPEFFDDKKKWGKVEILGRTFNTPANPKKYLTYYYGKWKKEEKGWHWSNSKSYINWETLGGGEWE